MSLSEAALQSYLDRHKVQALVEDAINDAVKAQADEPLQHIARCLQKSSPATISSVHARQIFDSRGNPTVECDVTTALGTFTAAVPSGASTGVYEGERAGPGPAAIPAPHAPPPHDDRPCFPAQPSSCGTAMRAATWGRACPRP